jgi:hypothetical protein
LFWSGVGQLGWQLGFVGMVCEYVGVGGGHGPLVRTEHGFVVVFGAVGLESVLSQAVKDIAMIVIATAAAPLRFD